MFPSATITFWFTVTLFVFVVIYVLASADSKKKHPTYHYVEGEFTNVCVFKQYKRHSEYREYRFRQTEDGKYKFVVGPWIRNLIMKMFGIDAAVLLVAAAMWYRSNGSLSGIDIEGYLGLVVLFSIMYLCSELAILQKTKNYLRKKDL